MIDGINIGELTGWGVAGIVLVAGVWLIFKGVLVPGSTARMWFEAWQTDRHTVEKLADQVDSLTKGQQTITTFIGEIKAAGDRAERRRERSP